MDDLIAFFVNHLVLSKEVNGEELPRKDVDLWHRVVLAVIFILTHFDGLTRDDLQLLVFFDLVDVLVLGDELVLKQLVGSLELGSQLAGHGLIQDVPLLVRVEALVLEQHYKEVARNDSD